MVIPGDASCNEPVIGRPVGEDRNSPLNIGERIFQILFGMYGRSQMVIVLVANAELEKSDRILAVRLAVNTIGVPTRFKFGHRHDEFTPKLDLPVRRQSAVACDESVRIPQVELWLMSLDGICEVLRPLTPDWVGTIFPTESDVGRSSQRPVTTLCQSRSRKVRWHGDHREIGRAS